MIAIDINAERLELAKSLGATHVHQLKLESTDAEEVQSLLMNATGGEGVNFALDTSGQQSAMQMVPAAAVRCTISS